jgi:putative transposase
MRLIDEIHLEEFYLGARRIKSIVKRKSYTIGRIHVRSLMRRVGLGAIFRKPRISKPYPVHKVYFYLFLGLDIKEANSVCCLDVIYVPMPKGFCYLPAVMNWASRKVLSFSLSNTLDVSFSVEAIKETLLKYGTHDISNTYQGSQFISLDFSDILIRKNMRISMDGPNRWVDNIFIERLSKTIFFNIVQMVHF